MDGESMDYGKRMLKNRHAKMLSKQDFTQFKILEEFKQQSK